VHPRVHGRRDLRTMSKGWRESSKLDIVVGTLGWLYGTPP